MADQNITELPIKTNSGVASTDYMLGIDSAEGYQILVRDVAKYIVENYNGSSIIGSAQTVKSAFDALNGKKYELGSTPGNFLNNNDDLNQFYTPGTFACKSNATASSLSNCPTTLAFKLIVEFSTGNGNPCQTIIEYSTGTRYYRYTNKSDGTGWSAWVEQPTRAEITELNSNTWKKDPSTYTGNVDADNYTSPGFYSVGISTHSPFGNTVAYGVLIVFTSSLGGVQQLFIAAHNGNLYARGKNRGTDAFSSWYKITTTIVN